MKEIAYHTLVTIVVEPVIVAIFDGGYQMFAIRNKKFAFLKITFTDDIVVSGQIGVIIRFCDRGTVGKIPKRNVSVTVFDLNEFCGQVLEYIVSGSPAVIDKRYVGHLWN